MKKGLVDISELRNNVLKADFRGKSAYCFLIDNKIIKIYATKDMTDYLPLDLNKICDFSKYEADTIVFPNEYIREKGKLVGEISNFVDDKPITKSFKSNTKIDLLIENYELVVADMLTYSNILMHDLVSVNILYSESNGFHIIDTTEWNFGENTSRINIHNFNSQIVNEIFKYIELPIEYRKSYSFVDKKFAHNCLKYGSVGREFNDILERNINMKYRLLDMLYLYKRMYEIYASKELNTLEDMKKYTKILKKG